MAAIARRRYTTINVVYRFPPFLPSFLPFFLSFFLSFLFGVTHSPFKAASNVGPYVLFWQPALVC